MRDYRLVCHKDLSQSIQVRWLQGHRHIVCRWSGRRTSGTRSSAPLPIENQLPRIPCSSQKPHKSLRQGSRPQNCMGRSGANEGKWKVRTEVKTAYRSHTRALIFKLHMKSLRLVQMGFEHSDKMKNIQYEFFFKRGSNKVHGCLQTAGVKWMYHIYKQKKLDDSTFEWWYGLSRERYEYFCLPLS